LDYKVVSRLRGVNVFTATKKAKEGIALLAINETQSAQKRSGQAGKLAFLGAIRDDTQRDVIKLHYVEGLSFAEIGERCGLRPKAAAKIARQGREALAGSKAFAENLETLSDEDQREIVRMRLIEGLSYEEIGKRCGMTVYPATKRAKQALALLAVNEASAVAA
jgi:DNA-directed RNA polymerase specialized sigma24 family protein